MDALQTVVRAGEYLLPSVAVAAVALLLLGRLLPIGLPSRIWIGTYLVVLGGCWLVVIACWISVFSISPDNHASGEAFLVAITLSWIVVPLSLAAIAGSLWRCRIN